MSDCTQRSEGPEGMPHELDVKEQVTPVMRRPKRTNSVNRLTVVRETT
jgi:hypothetical protein